MIGTITGLHVSIEIVFWIGLASLIIAIIYTKLTMKEV